MNRLSKLMGFVFVGLVSALLLYILQVVAIIEPLRSASGHSPESYLGVAFMVMLPLSLFVGSGITGYFGSRHIKTKLGFLLISPGLYFSTVLAVITVMKAGEMIPWFTEWLLQLEVYWFFVSWAGVGVGHFIRCKTR